MSCASSDPAIRHYQNVHGAFQRGDISRLEDLARLSDFPCGTDGWLNRHWLSTALETGNTDAVAWVLSKNPDVHYIDDEGFTALMTALQTEVDTAQMTGAKPDVEKTAALTIALIDQLLDAGVNINQRVTLGATALHKAAGWSSAQVIRHLLDSGADPHICDTDYVPVNALDIARGMKRREICVLLEDAMRGPGHRSRHDRRR